ncbi:hypothetical protein KOW79_018309 [Hemibagrus wyckioides]|uniref:Uncharacterized protein n=1 Tax=Hemibagrus wyckioides TaxID=337641 RepID=A0A9D3NBW4_9TELE|nr:hypothetical protein KOW79_018309 [Hemibagrus wyckioides]
MLVKVRFEESQKYVKVAKTEEGYEDFNTEVNNNGNIKSVIEKLGLPLQTELHLTDESGTEVDADVFEELLQAGNLTVMVSTEQSRGLDSDLPSILLLVHLLPPTSKGHKKSAKISSYQAVDHVVRYLQIEISVETFLAGVKSGQPFLLSVVQDRDQSGYLSSSSLTNTLSCSSSEGDSCIEWGVLIIGERTESACPRTSKSDLEAAKGMVRDALLTKSVKAETA